MKTEKWECTVCGSPCRVEIEFESTKSSHVEKQDRFRLKRCLCQETTSQWKRVSPGEKGLPEQGNDRTIKEDGTKAHPYIFNLHPPDGVEYNEHIKTFGFFLSMLQYKVFECTATYLPNCLTISTNLWPVVEKLDGWVAEACQEHLASSVRVKRLGDLKHHNMSVLADTHQRPGGHLVYYPRGDQKARELIEETKIEFKVIEEKPEKICPECKGTGCDHEESAEKRGPIPCGSCMGEGIIKED